MIKRFFDKGRITPISSRKIAPPLATSNNPGLARSVSVNRLRSQHSVSDFCVPVSDLAVGLKRDTRAVGRDVDLLERFGLLRTRYEKNPGHGKRRIVESRAAKYQLIATIYSTN